MSNPKKIRRRLLASLPILLVLAFITTVKVFGDNMNLGEKKATEVAGKEALRRGYDIENMDVSVMSSAEFISKYTTYFKERPALQLKLRDKKYRVVYYSPKEMQFGGDLLVFLGEGGEVLELIRGK